MLLRCRGAAVATPLLSESEQGRLNVTTPTDYKALLFFSAHDIIIWRSSFVTHTQTEHTSNQLGLCGLNPTQRFTQFLFVYFSRHKALNTIHNYLEKGGYFSPLMLRNAARLQVLEDSMM